MANLPTNFKDDILNTSVNTRRRYRMYENTDGTIELEDVTEYSQVGDEFGAGQINATNTEVNKKFDKNMIVRDLDTINAITKEGYVPDALALKEVNNSLGGLKFGTDGEGNYGYFGDDDVLVPFKSGLQGNVVFSQTTKVKTVTINNLTKGNKYLLEVTVDSSNGSAQALKDVVITSASGCTFTLVNTHSANYYGASKMYLIETTDTTITLNSSGYAMWYLFE